MSIDGYLLKNRRQYIIIQIEIKRYNSIRVTAIQHTVGPIEQAAGCVGVCAVNVLKLRYMKQFFPLCMSEVLHTYVGLTW